ncbi:type III secretion system chaperone family protein [Cyclobacterium amurskyense]|uniref:Molecular chaperone Tir n=1 Tax=Cyclobacterium amurskyense TaxID=320787 RepID=A0A0H4P8J7_9BACT|nr:molecular chaperone Tir [Cyclobacterium amurskyense]AKP50811.1 Molecular chaperone Tir [Cyclobacterium amurskyense]|tara:strand:+ start:44283 stop:44678 length:396 start_codon:yes stop_codon:yes gene_type:complete
MDNYYNRIIEFLLKLDVDITKENPDEGILVIQKEDNGIKNLIVGIVPPVLILEQYIFKIKNNNNSIYKSLLQKNRDIIHGAFVLDDDGDKVIFRDTLQIENLDLNEIEASLNSLSLLLSEYSEQIIKFSKY